MHAYGNTRSHADNRIMHKYSNLSYQLATILASEKAIDCYGCN